MLDVVLYRQDHRGLLRLRERAFSSLRDLARHIASQQDIAWEWAEITFATHDGGRRYLRYSAEDLRRMIVDSGLHSSLN